MLANSVRGLGAGARAALVIHEAQRGMVDTELVPESTLARHADSRGVVQNIVALAHAFRARDLPVLFSTIEPRPDYVGTAVPSLLLGSFKKKGSVVGSAAASLHPMLEVSPSDIVIRRVHGLTPFHGTELEWYLRERAITTIVLSGVSTDIGIPAACVEAVNRGFQVVVAEDCIAGSSAEAHAWQVAHTLPLLSTVVSFHTQVIIGLDQ